jgi:hypothetical protein
MHVCCQVLLTDFVQQNLCCKCSLSHPTILSNCHNCTLFLLYLSACWVHSGKLAQATTSQALFFPALCTTLSFFHHCPISVQSVKCQHSILFSHLSTSAVVGGYDVYHISLSSPSIHSFSTACRVFHLIKQPWVVLCVGKHSS